MNFLEHIIVNPKVELVKGAVYPFVAMADVSTIHRKPDNIEFKSFSSGVKFAKGDTVIARIEPCLQNGKKFYWTDFDCGFGSTEFLVFRPKDEFIDSMFLFYFMQQEKIYKNMINSMTGTTGRQRVNNDVFRHMNITLPPIETQTRIASILSKYDDLIENSRQQIKLLEEAGQLLYREWFVRLRFPGHEDTEIIDGLPDGWRIGTLGEVAEFRRGKTITKAQTEKGSVPVVAGGTEPAYYHSEANTSSPVITVSASGNAGFTRLYFEDIFASDCSFADITMTRNILFAYCFLKSNSALLKSMQRGTAQQHVYAKDINAMKITIPCDKVLGMFYEYTKPYMELTGNLMRKIKLCTEARDRLLPKLMSGEIQLKETC